METHGRLTLIEILAERSDDKRVMGRWACSCGNDKTIAASRVRKGNTKSCGCLAREASSASHMKHGMRESREYSTWVAVKGRCTSQTNKDYPKYGGAGITLHKEWAESFEAFYLYMGARPTGTSIDRIDTQRGYEPGNVRWATGQVQQRNRRTSYVWHIKGSVFQSITEASTHFNVSEHTIWRWVNGQQDNRRNTFTESRGDCHVVSRY